MERGKLVYKEGVTVRLQKILREKTGKERESREAGIGNTGANAGVRRKDYT